MNRARLMWDFLRRGERVRGRRCLACGPRQTKKPDGDGERLAPAFDDDESGGHDHRMRIAAAPKSAR